MDFSFLNLATYYKVDIDGEEKIDFMDSSRACFYQLFREINSRDHEDHEFKCSIRLWLTDKALNDKRNNKVFVNEEEIRWYFNQLNKVVPFNYTLAAGEEEDIVLTIQLSTSPIKLKWLLTCIRYLYEHPFSIAIAEAIRLKMNKKFINVNVINVFNLIGSTVCGDYNWNENHTVGRCDRGLLKFINFKTLAKKLETYSDALEDVYLSATRTGLFSYNYPQEFDNSYLSIENILDRYKNYYYQNYKILQNTKNYIQNG